MSTTINFSNIVKRFGEKTVIPGLSMHVNDGEFFTLLGPSGCGKTTLLRMIAGFNSIEGGEIAFGDRVINDVPPGKRNIGMVFQNYAIFPHLSVKDNVAFGLKNRQVSKADINRRVDEILKTVEMSEHKDSMPDKLSGGQQQRIALARAIVIHPDILLMDEPLSNLDAKLRVSMRNAIKEIQKSVNITTVYVTHDQEEAMAVSDRIAIMNGGVLQHIGTPRNIYHRPANTFVATFIGHSNILDARLINGELRLADNYSEKMDNLRLPATMGNDSSVKVSVRPEEFIVIKNGDMSNTLGATVKSSTYLGLNTHYFVQLDIGKEVEIVEESTLNEEIRIGSRIGLKVKQEKINVFDSSGDVNFTEGVMNDV